MWVLVCVFCAVWECQSVIAYPVNPSILEDSNSHSNRDFYWVKYAIGLLGVTATAFTLVGCLCCRRNKRPKGFQEFTNRPDLDAHSFHGLELEVPLEITQDRVQFEPLPVTLNDIYATSKPKPPPPSPSLFSEKDPEQVPTKLAQEWHSDLQIPRESLKYVKEVGTGWFGKVVEGCVDLENLRNLKTLKHLRNGSVVVKILGEEASSKEKTWFLGEATPYVKLRHRNILSLLGSCLETDPYLLLFESCPLGDLKGFLRANNDPASRETLVKENMPGRIAIEVASGLRHMHENGFFHTDLSARNCLVASDLTVKIGDYGNGVVKYPMDYYVVGDRALPIRWSSPESLLCTETTIETREITPTANIWSYAILLWEIATWGARPYDDLDDEQVIQMLLSTSPKAESTSLKLLIFHLDEGQKSVSQVIQSCLVLDPKARPDLAELRHALLKEKLNEEDFEMRWDSLKPRFGGVRSVSLQDLRGGGEEELWGTRGEEEKIVQQTSFVIGPGEPVKNAPVTFQKLTNIRESDSDLEDESMITKVQRGAFTEKVKQKSKSVADLMVLVYIDPDPDSDLSLGPTEKSFKKRQSAYGSDGDLCSAVLADEFDQALKKLQKSKPDLKERHHTERDLSSWNNALDSALEEKMSSYLVESEFQESRKKGDDTGYHSTDTILLTPQSLEGDTEILTSKKQTSVEEDEEEYRKRVSTPDDERSSDSGFRDKESCEDEESPLPRLVKLPIDGASLTQETAEEEQIRILLELDSILDAEYVETPTDSLPECTVRENEFYLRGVYEDVANTGNEEHDDSTINDATLPPLDKLCSKNEANILDDFGGERVGDNEVEDDGSSTVSLQSDNSYVSFNIDEEFVTAIRNELKEKLAQAQMNVVEPQELRDEEDEGPSVASDGERTWEEEEGEEYSCEQGSGIDISIRYNLYGAPLSPILEERESALNSESQISPYNSNSHDVSIASKSSITEEDVLLVNTRTNQALLVEAVTVSPNLSDDDDDDDDEEDREFENTQDGPSTASGVLLPSPEEESKWQKMSCTYPTQDDCMMTTSFAQERDWDKVADDEEEEEEENSSSSSGEFVWKRYDKSRADLIDADTYHRGAMEKMYEEEEEEDENEEQETMEKENAEEGAGSEDDVEDVEEEEEFKPSTWDVNLEPTRSALRSPEKSLKSSDQKKNVWFKKQNYYCVYEYPKEVSTVGAHEQSTTSWEPTTYADWEEMMNESRLDFYPLEYTDTNNEKDDEFFVTSSNRPFQLQIGNEKFASQFFPGANFRSHNQAEKDVVQDEKMEEKSASSSSQQLGELRHTRDRLKLNLLSSNGATFSPGPNNNGDNKETENPVEKSETNAEETKSEDENVVQNKKLSPSENYRGLDLNDNCGFIEHG